MMSIVPVGYRIVIGEHEVSDQSPHQCGGTVLGVRSTPVCPNCSQDLFPVFKLDNSDPAVADLGLWRMPFLQVLVCPACALYMEPYWVRFSVDEVVIHGGERDTGEVLQEIESPYESRPIRLRQLAEEEDAMTAASRQALLNRDVPPGIYHQLGGQPFRGSRDPLVCVVCSRTMAFGGIVDYDDSNVPLYEPVRRPVALIIGDGDCLHYFTCRDCDVIGVRWQR